jgi:coenzyme Q-binding protein COQ10
MPSFDTTRRVPFTPRQMFDLVADVEKYPQFLPMCESLVVRRREELEEGIRLTATMGVGYGAIKEHFTSRVSLYPAERQILVQYIDGPFRYLDNRWDFLPDGGGTIVRFRISYEFKSAMLGLLMGALFDKAFRKFSEAFEQRAHVVYGESRPSAVS